ncbi:hypothetical protein [Aureispira anguillae]|uniref:Uncharacterized protein n=1 Tax=Aureispira anguillae TaxID=2864201 RepID=A0A915YKV0_9BACT|nr:hypothetical protein [Aureispira anguillae]BDS15074.1 hypothetical protein AsAng_0058560 [Aureispira anguillae]
MNNNILDEGAFIENEAPKKEKQAYNYREVFFPLSLFVLFVWATYYWLNHSESFIENYLLGQESFVNTFYTRGNINNDKLCNWSWGLYLFTLTLGELILVLIWDFRRIYLCIDYRLYLLNFVKGIMFLMLWHNAHILTSVLIVFVFLLIFSVTIQFLATDDFLI